MKATLIVIQNDADFTEAKALAWIGELYDFAARLGLGN